MVGMISQTEAGANCRINGSQCPLPLATCLIYSASNPKYALAVDQGAAVLALGDCSGLVPLASQPWEATVDNSSTKITRIAANRRGLKFQGICI